MWRRLVPLAIVSALVLAAAVSVFAQTAKPNGYAWVKTYPAYLDATKVELIFTDVSDQVWARFYDINYVSRGETRPQTSHLVSNGSENLDRIYFVANRPQWPILETDPADGYTPLHIIIIVTWINRNDAYPLLSEADVLLAESLGLVELTTPGLYLNAPKVVWEDGLIIPQAVTAGGPFPFRFRGGCKFIKLPTYLGYVDNRTATFLKTDFEDYNLADEYGANFSPALHDANPSGMDVCYRFLIDAPCWSCPRNQWSVYGEAPSPVLWRNKNRQYMPIRQHWTVDRGDDCLNVYRNAELVEMLIGNGTLSVVRPDSDGNMNSPTISIPSGNTLK